MYLRKTLKRNVLDLYTENYKDYWENRKKASIIGEINYVQCFLSILRCQFFPNLPIESMKCWSKLYKTLCLEIDKIINLHGSAKNLKWEIRFW